MRRSRSSMLAGALALGIAALARADGPTVHEYVPDVEDNEGTILVSSGGPQPEALVYDGEVIPAPQGGALASGEHAMDSAPGDSRETEDVGRRSPTFRPDRVTALDGQIGYYEVFTPTISPFKRVTALDGITLVGTTPVLAIADRGPRRQVEVEGAQTSAPDARARDRFWGSVVLDFTGGHEVPLPSVSPESRLLTVRTEPEVHMHFERDGADNYFAILDEPDDRLAPIRVVFLTDAPRSYFGGQLPAVPVDALIEEVPQMPPSLERRALEFDAQLGLGRESTFDDAVERLVEHFRSFREDPHPPHDTGDIFWDLANGMVGVCRHRAYAFVIAAQALGIMARFVQNEAHAWVEVHVPEGRGWLRIDLGGSPRGLEAHNSEDRPAYHPETGDSLPRPDAYVQAYAEARATSEGTGATAGAAGATETGATGGGATGTGGGAARPQASVALGAATETRAPLELQLDVERTIAVMRGRTFEVSGTARTGDLGVAGLRIEVLLSAERSVFERSLGVTVTNEHGVFHGTFGVPPDLVVGDYRLVVRSPGNQHVAPAIAR